MTYLAILPNPHCLQVAMFAQCFFHDKHENAEKSTRTNSQPGEHVAFSVQIAIHQMIASAQFNIHRFWRIARLDIKSPVATRNVGLGPKGATCN